MDPICDNCPHLERDHYVQKDESWKPRHYGRGGDLGMIVLGTFGTWSTN